MTAHKGETVARTIALTKDEWSALDTALTDIEEMLRDVGNVLSALAWSDVLGRLDMKSLMRITARAIESMERKEMHALGRLDVVIRCAALGK